MRCLAGLIGLVLMLGYCQPLYAEARDPSDRATRADRNLERNEIRQNRLKPTPEIEIQPVVPTRKQPAKKKSNRAN